MLPHVLVVFSVLEEVDMESVPREQPPLFAMMT
jgi:hypothetical protein